MTHPALPSESSRRTTVTRLTPAGRGAVATLSVEGADALAIVGEFFRPNSGGPLIASEVDRIRFGSWRHDNGDVEEIVVCRRTAGVVEIHCHGGDAAVNAIIATLASRRAVLGDAATWLQRQHQDPLCESVRLQLAEARTQRTAGILLDQLHGTWPRTLDRIKSLLAAVDQDPAAWQLATTQLQRLISLVPVGLHLTTPWQVVVVGPPNVGKSSLVNTMLGFSRCIVFDQPGTTRDIVATHTALDGWPVELMDTAGLRDGQDAIEAEGVSRAMSKVMTADLVVHVSDATRLAPSVLDPAIETHPNLLMVENKSDLLARPPRGEGIPTSAVTKAGVGKLIESIVWHLVPQPPVPGEAVPIDDRQRKLLEAVRASVTSGDMRRAAELLSR